jgi:protein gp37
VFCSSLADVFEDRAELAPWREDLFDLIERTPNLIWQLLTKRPQNVRPMTRARWFYGLPANVWVGTTVEDQQRADERIPHLLNIPARVRFLSCEPLLDDVRLPQHALGCDHDGRDQIVKPDLWRCDACGQVVRYVDDPDGPITVHDLATRTRRRIREEWVRGGRTIDWVIVGGESGPGHRPLDLAHAGSLVEQCERAGVPVFFKQVGGRTPAAGGDVLDGRRIKQFPREACRG